MSVKNFLLILFFAVSLLNASEMRVVNTSGPDMVFRALLIEKSLRGDGLKCVVTQDTFDNAVKKLISAKADIVLVKDDGRLLKNLPQRAGAREKAFHEWFDGLKTLRFLHQNADFSGDF